MGIFGAFGHHHRFKERVFEKGDLKYVILDLLRERPRHGYEVIRDLEERFGGFYSPSPGAVYPTLQMLEDQEFLTSDRQDGKRVYSITEEGRAFLDQRQSTVEGIEDRTRERFGSWFDEKEVREFAEEMRTFAHNMKDLARLFARSQGKMWRDPARRERLREVLKRTQREIEEIMKE